MPQGAGAKAHGSQIYKKLRQVWDPAVDTDQLLLSGLLRKGPRNHLDSIATYTRQTGGISLILIHRVHNHFYILQK